MERSGDPIKPGTPDVCSEPCGGRMVYHIRGSKSLEKELSGRHYSARKGGWVSARAALRSCGVAAFERMRIILRRIHVRARTILTRRRCISQSAQFEAENLPAPQPCAED